MKKILIYILVTISVIEGLILWQFLPSNKNLRRSLKLPSFSYYDISSTGIRDDYVSIQGTWISTTKLAFPIQTSRIICYRNWNSCIESKADLSVEGPIEGSFLHVLSEIYEIDKWLPDEITMKPVDSAMGCTRYTMRIDRLNKQVTAVRTTLNNTGECAGVDKEPMHLHLVDGFEVYKSR